MRSQFQPSSGSDLIQAVPSYDVYGAAPQQQTKSGEIDWDSMPAEIVPHAKAAHGVLKEYGMDKHEARVRVLLDVSLSMQNPNKFFKHPEKGNRVQTLLNKALALAFLFDDNTTIDIIPFGDKAYPTVTVTQDNFRDATTLVVQAIGGQLKDSTNYAAALRQLRDSVFDDTGNRDKVLVCEDDPVFTIFVTDGEPNVEKTHAAREFISLSYTGTFIKMLALHGHEEDFEFLNNVATGEHGKMHIDNFDLVTLEDPDDLTMSLLIRKYRGWLEEAHERKMLAIDPQIVKFDVQAEGRHIEHLKQHGKFAHQHHHHHHHHQANTSSTFSRSSGNY